LSSLQDVVDDDDPLLGRVEFVDVGLQVDGTRLLVLNHPKLIFKPGDLILQLFLRFP
jgi:hypothetical protein